MLDPVGVTETGGIQRAQPPVMKLKLYQYA